MTNQAQRLALLAKLQISRSGITRESRTEIVKEWIAEHQSFEDFFFALEQIQTPEHKTEIINHKNDLWLNSGTVKKREDLREIVNNYFTNRSNVTQIFVQKWLDYKIQNSSQHEQILQNLEPEDIEVLNLVADRRDQSRIAEACIANYDPNTDRYTAKENLTPENTLKFLEFVEELFDGNYIRSKIAIACAANYDPDNLYYRKGYTAKENLTPENTLKFLEFVEDSFDDDFIRSKIAATCVAAYDSNEDIYITKENITLEDIDKFFRFFGIGEMREKDQIISSCKMDLRYEEGKLPSEEELQSLSNRFRDKEIKSKVFASLIANRDPNTSSYIAKDWVVPDDLEKVFKFIDNDFIKSRIVETCFIKTYDPNTDRYIAKENLTVKDLEKFSEFFGNYLDIRDLAVTCKMDLGYEEGKLPSEEELQDLTNRFQNKKIKSAVFASLVATYNPNTNGYIAKDWVTPYDLEKVFKFIDHQYTRSTILDTCKMDLGYEEGKLPSEEELQDLSNRFQNEEIKPAVFASLISTYDPNNRPCYIIKDWVTLEDLEKVCEFIPPYPDFIISYLSAEQDVDSRTNKLALALKHRLFEDFDVNEPENFRKISYRCNSDLLPAAQIPNLCKTLYPNSDILQSMLFCEFVSGRHSKELNQDKEVLLEFILGINDKEYAFDAFDALRQKITFSNNLEKLEILRNISSRNYVSLVDSLKEYTLEDSLNEFGLAKVQYEFGDIDLSKFTLADLFSYQFLEENGLRNYKDSIKEKILKDTALNLHGSERSAFFSNKEVEVIKYLFADVIFNTEEKKELRSIFISDLTSYLNSKLESQFKKIKDFSNQGFKDYKLGDSSCFETIANLRFAQENASTEAKFDKDAEVKAVREEFSKNFEDLLCQEKIRYDKVIDFFKSIFDSENTSQLFDSPANKNSLCEFFKSQKDRLAFLFKEDGGLDKMMGKISALEHGCYANISTQFSSALNKALIDNYYDQILFQVFDENIATPIINSGEANVHGGGDEHSILNNQEIKSHILSLNGLVAAIKNQFYRNKKVVSSNKPLQFIKVNYGQKVSDAFMEECFDEYSSYKNRVAESKNTEEDQKKYGQFTDCSDFINSKAAEFSAYLVLKNSFATTKLNLFGYRELRDFKSNNEQIEINLQKIAKPSSSPSPSSPENASEKMSSGRI